MRRIIVINRHTGIPEVSYRGYGLVVWRFFSIEEVRRSIRRFSTHFLGFRRIRWGWDENVQGLLWFWHMPWTFETISLLSHTAYEIQFCNLHRPFLAFGRRMCRAIPWPWKVRWFCVLTAWQQVVEQSLIRQTVEAAGAWVLRAQTLEHYATPCCHRVIWPMWLTISPQLST